MSRHGRTSSGPHPSIRKRPEFTLEMGSGNSRAFQGRVIGRFGNQVGNSVRPQCPNAAKRSEMKLETGQC